MGVLAGRPLEFVSIRKGERYAGLTRFVPVEPPDFTLAPYALQDRAYRDFIETSMMVDLAGPVGGLFCPPADALYLPDDDEADERRAREQAAALDRQSPRHRELIVADERRTDPAALDEDRAWTLSSALVVPDAVYHHVELMRAETMALLVAHRRQLAAIAAALRTQHVLTQADVDAALAGTRCACHSWSVKQKEYA